MEVYVQVTVGVVVLSLRIVNPRNALTAIPIPETNAVLVFLNMAEIKVAAANKTPKRTKGQPSNGGHPGSKGQPSLLIDGNMISCGTGLESDDKASVLSDARTLGNSPVRQRVFRHKPLSHRLLLELRLQRLSLLRYSLLYEAGNHLPRTR